MGGGRFEYVAFLDAVVEEGFEGLAVAGECGGGEPAALEFAVPGVDVGGFDVGGGFGAVGLQEAF